MTEAEKEKLAREYAQLKVEQSLGALDPLPLRFAFLAGLKARPKLTDEEKNFTEDMRHDMKRGLEFFQHEVGKLLDIIDRLTSTENGGT